MTTGVSRFNGLSRWVGIALTAFLAIGAFIVQWGVVTTKLGTIEQRLEEIATEFRIQRTSLASVEQRVSFLEGKIDGRKQAKP